MSAFDPKRTSKTRLISVEDKAAIVSHCRKDPTTFNNVSAHTTEVIWVRLISFHRYIISKDTR
ncbi:MAG: hypothetical protein WA756_25055, partial [Pseudolabrys sp.]|jgi:hypothetical protein